MKHLFLTSQISHVASHIGAKLKLKPKTQLVYLVTSIRDKSHSNLEWHYSNKASLEKIGFQCLEYDISGKPADEVIQYLDQFKYLYIEGGNSFYLLQESQKINLATYLSQRVEQDLTYLSTSAGTVIAGPNIDPVHQDSRVALAPTLKGTKGYGLVNYVIMPHWGQSERRELFNTFRLNHIYKENYPYIFISDSQYIEVQGAQSYIINTK